jgi:hypothetical protein
VAFKLLSKDGTWQTILKRKYVGSKALSQVLWKLGDSYFWVDLVAKKKVFFRLGSYTMKEGSEIWFWEDRWLGNITLREQYPTLYYIVHHKSDIIAKVLKTSLPNVKFGRDLSGQRLVSWNVFAQYLANVHLQIGLDEFHWNLHENGKCSVDYIYNMLIQLDVPTHKL